ncbi:MAG TPA: ChbG/HpnK family deacetylase [Acidobacteriaceae bacterium]
MKRLIVNADDFGLTAGVNSAITQLHASHRLTSATLMACAEATEGAIEAARKTPSLGVGCHIVLVDGVPVLPAKELPTLTDPQSGRFRRTLGIFVRDLLSGRIRSEEIEAEAIAQMQRLRTHGISLTHVDTHKHTHMFHGVLAPLLKAAAQSGVSAIRNPFEPDWSTAATGKAPALRRLQVRVLNQMRSGFLRRVSAAGLATTDGAIGVLATGTLDAETIDALFAAMPSGTWELVTHPGYVDDALPKAGTRLIASRAIELAALKAMRAPTEIEWIHFGQLRETAHVPQIQVAP